MRPGQAQLIVRVEFGIHRFKGQRRRFNFLHGLPDGMQGGDGAAIGSNPTDPDREIGIGMVIETALLHEEYGCVMPSVFHPLLHPRDLQTRETAHFHPLTEERLQAEEGVAREKALHGIGADITVSETVLQLGAGIAPVLVAHPPAQRMHHAGAFLVNVCAVSMLMTDAGNRQRNIVLRMGQAQHIGLMCLHGVEIRLGTVHLFEEELFRVTGPAFVQPHVFRALAGDVIAPPMVRQFMCHERFLGQGSVYSIERIGNVPGMFHGAGVERHGVETHLAKAVFAVGFFKSCKGLLQVGERFAQVGRVFRLCGQTVRNTALHAAQGAVDPGIGGDGHAGEVSRHRFVHHPAEGALAASGIDYLLKVAVADGTQGRIAGDIEAVERFVVEAVEAGKPAAAEGMRIGSKGHAHVPGVVAAEVESAPGGVGLRTAAVPDLQGICIALPVDAQRNAQLAIAQVESSGIAVHADRIHFQPKQVEHQAVVERRSTAHHELTGTAQRLETGLDVQAQVIAPGFRTLRLQGCNTGEEEKGKQE